MSNVFDNLLAWSKRIEEMNEQDRFWRSVQLNLAVGDITESWYAPRGSIARIEGVGMIMHPSTAMFVNNNMRTPLWTDRCAGVREAERDRRRNGARPTLS